MTTNIFIAPDVPQVLLDEFNKIDFEKVNSMMKTAFMVYVKEFAKRILIPKDKNKKYKSDGIKKRISRIFDPKLLHILNTVDWTLEENSSKINEILTMIKPYILQLPNRVKNNAE